MRSSDVIDRVQRICTARHDEHADRANLEAVLRDVTALRGWLSSVEADVIGRLTEQVSFPEAAICEATHSSSNAAGKAVGRSETLGETPELASKLDDGEITADHVDVVTRAAGGVDADQRNELLTRCDGLADVAANATVDQWRARVKDVVRDVQRRAGIDRLERQRRATTLSSWVDNEGMWNLRGRFDPLTGASLAARLDAEVHARFAEATPDTCPSDPVAKQQHLRALALAGLIADGGRAGTAGRPEYVVVVDITSDRTAPPVASGSPSWDVTWPIPIEVPDRVLRQLMSDHPADVQPVIVANGIVLHAPGELDLGRTTRLANRAQRRALRGLYANVRDPRMHRRL